VALKRLVEGLETAGRFEEAERLIRKALKQGLKGTERDLAEFLDKQGRAQEAKEYWKMVDSGDPHIMSTLGELTGFNDDMYRREQTIAMLRRKARTGDGRAMGQLGTLLAKSQKFNESEYWIRAAHDAGEPMNWFFLAWLKARDWKYDKVNEMLLSAALSGDVDAAKTWVRFLRDSKYPITWERVEEVLAVVLNAAPREALPFADLFIIHGKVGNAVELAKLVYEKTSFGFRQLLALLVDSGDSDEANHLFQEAIKNGEPLTYKMIARDLEDSGNASAAEAMLREALILEVDSSLANDLEGLLLRLGREEEAERLKTFGLNLDGSTSAPW
jgi:tetratricopeptide (TPR) repeat protein